MPRGRRRRRWWFRVMRLAHALDRPQVYSDCLWPLAPNAKTHQSGLAIIPTYAKLCTHIIKFKTTKLDAKGLSTTHTVSAKCETIGSQPEPCVFPFKYGGQTFNRCTSTDAETGSVWCATKVDDKGVVVEGRWGDCSEGCPGAREFQFQNGSFSFSKMHN